METSPARRRWAPAMAVACTAVALVGATSTQTPAQLDATPAAQRAVITLKPGTIRARDIASRQIQPRHFGLRTMSQLNGAGPAAQRPRATRATAGWLYFANDIDGGALFRSDGRSWEQLTTGRLGRIARNSIDSSRIKPGGIVGSRLADDSVTARAMSMDAWRAISTSGPLGSRPDATARPAGSFYFATDVQGGTLYQGDGVSWVRVASLGAEANISAASITSDLIATDAVTATQLANGSVGSAQLAAGAVGSTQLADGGVALVDIDPAVWSDRLATGTIGARPAAASSNANSLYYATDDAGGTLHRSDGAAWSVVGRSRSPRTVNFMFGAWTNMPAALSEMYGTNRSHVPMDLSTASQVRMSTNVVTVGFGTTPAQLCAQYSVDGGASWANFDDSAGTSCASGVAHVTVNVLGLRQSLWQDLPAAARSENAIVRIAGIGGNGAVDPNFGVTALEVR